MSSKQARKTRVKIAIACATVGIPFILAVEAAEMTAICVFLIGAWVFCLETIAANMEWKNDFVRRVTRNAVVRVVAVAFTFAATGWFVHAVHKPPLIDPEATENKYVHVTPRVSPPDGKSKYAMLIEFGVNKVPSEGIAVAVRVNTDYWTDWYGEPGRTDGQLENDAEMRRDGKYSAENTVIRLSNGTLQLTPRKSYYLCITSSRELRDPNDILYFAVELNERTTLSPQKELLGHQYQRRQ